MRFWVYKIYGRRKLLYVGMTGNLPARIKAHRMSSKWFPSKPAITWTEYTTKRLALSAERVAIELGKPIHNGKATYKGTIPFVGETWRHMTLLNSEPVIPA